jgi:hypothetical protein
MLSHLAAAQTVAYRALRTLVHLHRVVSTELADIWTPEISAERWPRQSFLRVHWVAVPKAVRARRVNAATPPSCGG